MQVIYSLTMAILHRVVSGVYFVFSAYHAYLPIRKETQRDYHLHDA